MEGMVISSPWGGWVFWPPPSQASGCIVPLWTSLDSEQLRTASSVSDSMSRPYTCECTSQMFSPNNYAMRGTARITSVTRWGNQRVDSMLFCFRRLKSRALFSFANWQHKRPTSALPNLTLMLLLKHLACVFGDHSDVCRLHTWPLQLFPQSFCTNWIVPQYPALYLWRTIRVTHFWDSNSMSNNLFFLHPRCVSVISRHILSLLLSLLFIRFWISRFFFHSITLIFHSWKVFSSWVFSPWFPLYVHTTLKGARPQK